MASRRLRADGECLGGSVRSASRKSPPPRPTPPNGDARFAQHHEVTFDCPGAGLVAVYGQSAALAETQEKSVSKLLRTVVEAAVGIGSHISTADKH